MISSLAVKQGVFIVLEGIDGSGTTTQLELLRQKLQARASTVVTTREPSDGVLGALIRQILACPEEHHTLSSWGTMALLFAADRLHHVESTIVPVLKSGAIVLSDRYDASSLGYQSLASGLDGKDALEWVRSLNRFALRPHLTVVLDVPAEDAARRRRIRGGRPELYEQSELQKKLAAFYRDLASILPNDRIECVDGIGSVEEVSVRVENVVMPFLE